MCSNGVKSDDTMYKPQIHKGVKEKEPLDMGERRLLVPCAICLSVFGVIAFLISGQIAVVIAMNAPLLAIIRKRIFFEIGMNLFQ